MYRKQNIFIAHTDDKMVINITKISKRSKIPPSLCYTALNDLVFGLEKLQAKQKSKFLLTSKMLVKCEMTQSTAIN